MPKNTYRCKHRQNLSTCSHVSVGYKFREGHVVKYQIGKRVVLYKETSRNEGFSVHGFQINTPSDFAARYSFLC